jgi:isocitrate dehydrogenase
MATDLVVSRAGTFELVFTPAGGGNKEVTKVYDFKSPGVIMGMYNTDEVLTRQPNCTNRIFRSSSPPDLS